MKLSRKSLVGISIGTIVLSAIAVVLLNKVQNVEIQTVCLLVLLTAAIFLGCRFIFWWHRIKDNQMSMIGITRLIQNPMSWLMTMLFGLILGLTINVIWYLLAAVSFIFFFLTAYLIYLKNNPEIVKRYKKSIDKRASEKLEKRSQKEKDVQRANELVTKMRDDNAKRGWH